MSNPNVSMRNDVKKLGGTVYIMPYYITSIRKLEFGFYHSIYPLTIT